MSKEQPWDNERTIVLIKLYEKHSLLWDPKDKNYRNKIKRNDSLLAIASEIGANVDVIKKKFDSLLSQFRREQKNIATKWWGIKHFQFLHEKVTPRLSNTRPQSQDDNDNNDNEDFDDIQPSGSEQHAPSSSLHSTKSHYAPPKKVSRKEESYCSEMTKVRKVYVGRDDLSSYGETVANRLRNIQNRRTRLILMNKIDNMLFSAELEECEFHETPVSAVSSPGDFSNEGTLYAVGGADTTERHQDILSGVSSICSTLEPHTFIKIENCE